jgi:hypothetical protein
MRETLYSRAIRSTSRDRRSDRIEAIRFAICLRFAILSTFVATKFTSDKSEPGRLSSLSHRLKWSFVVRFRLVSWLCDCP